MRETTLLPPKALTGVRLALSASASPDLDRLGLTETHVQLALGEIARSVLVAGGTLAYGGHLDPGGYTQFLFGELKRYATPVGTPLAVYLAWTEHRRVALSVISAARDALSSYGAIVCLDPDGATVKEAQGRGEAAPEPIPDRDLAVRSLTAMRRRMAAETTGRVVIGGKRHGVQGEIPGLMEEVLLCLERSPPQPVYLAGGFGGCTADIVAALGVAEMSWLPAPFDAPPDDDRWLRGKARLTALRDAMADAGRANGLTESERRRLAMTHRPSEIADLVTLGLGRMRAGAGTLGSGPAGQDWRP